jgi:Glycosyl hydrolase family 57.
MKLIVMFLEAHQPRRLSNFRYQDIGIRENYFWDEKNKEIIKRISQNSYIPTLSLLKDYSVPITLSFSGILLEQLWKYEPTVPDLLKEYFKAVAERWQLKVTTIVFPRYGIPKGF